MCRKLLLLIAVLGLVSTAWADDVEEFIPEWRGEPGSTTSWWGFDTAGPSGEEFWPMRAPETSQSFLKDPPHDDVEIGNFKDRAIDEGWVSHWEEGATWADPPTWVEGTYPMDMSHYEDNFALNLWAGGEGSPAVWSATFRGRTGVLSQFSMGSWDIYNFDSTQPLKRFQIQLTWQPYEREAIAFHAEVEYTKMEPLTWIEEGWWEFAGWNYDEAEYENWLEGWPGGEPPPEIWWEEGGWFCWGVYEVSWWLDEGGWLEEGWWIGGDEPVEYYLGWWDDEFLEPEAETDPDGNGWITSVFAFDLEPNPGVEFFGLFPSKWDSELGEWLEGGVISVDQAVIDTICVPEPFTISLLGLGGLLLIRRRKR